MECSEAREIASARMDGEASVSEAAVAAVHLESCRSCAAWSAAVDDVTRRLRVHPVEAIPNLADAALARATHVPMTPRLGAPRIGLALFAVAELVFAVVGGVSGTAATSVHGTQHLGAFAAAVAAGLLLVAWRPARAFGVLPIILALAVAIPVFAVIDWMNGELSVVGGLHHLAQVLGLALVWVLAGRPTPIDLFGPTPDPNIGPAVRSRARGAR